MDQKSPEELAAQGQRIRELLASLVIMACLVLVGAELALSVREELQAVAASATVSPVASTPPGIAHD